MMYTGRQVMATLLSVSLNSLLNAKFSTCTVMHVLVHVHVQQSEEPRFLTVWWVLRIFSQQSVVSCKLLMYCTEKKHDLCCKFARKTNSLGERKLCSSGQTFRLHVQCGAKLVSARKRDEIKFRRETMQSFSWFVVRVDPTSIELLQPWAPKHKKINKQIRVGCKLRIAIKSFNESYMCCDV